MTIKVVAGLINFNGKYFIGKRLFGEPAGKYEFPGGKIEPNETPENAIKREIKEEIIARGPQDFDIRYFLKKE